MWRVIVLIACALCVADAAGLIGDCDETCQDEQAGKQCPPACATCSCTGHAVRALATKIEIVTTVAMCETSVIVTPPPTIERGLLDPAPSLRPPIT